jgi:hypothetical protein
MPNFFCKRYFSLLAPKYQNQQKEDTLTLCDENIFEGLVDGFFDYPR